jgi:hypothetical protein
MYQEMCIVADKQKTVVNEEQILSYLVEVVEKIRTEEDPLELNAFRRLFRKAVPFTLRSYFAAYLLKQMYAGKSSSRNSPLSRNERSGRMNKKDRSETRSEGRNARQEEPKRNKQAETRRSDSRAQENRSAEARVSEPRQSESRVQEVRPVLADDVSTTLFISIGRNRRVYPRDLIGLIMQTVEIDREHIGEIRVLDNYSFVQVITEDAEKIIASLNEFEYRGRKLAVSYSRKRDEQPLAETAEGTSDPGYLRDENVEGEETDSGKDASWLSETDVSDNEEDNADIQ